MTPWKNCYWKGNKELRIAILKLHKTAERRAGTLARVKHMRSPENNGIFRFFEK